MKFCGTLKYGRHIEELYWRRWRLDVAVVSKITLDLGRDEGIYT